jgi:rhodanese-related sulfurtransferase
MCRRGNASKEATEKALKEFGVTNVINVEGGIEEI